MANLSLFDLTGKTAVVVGGAGGLGLGIAEALAEAGAKVMISSRSVESLLQAQAQIRDKTGIEIHYEPCDASDENSVIALLEAALKALGTVDILVNSQGFNKKYPGTETPKGVFDEMLSVNVTSVMLTCKHFGKYMKDNEVRGKIINLGSVRGIRAVGNGGGGNVAYCTTKGAIEMLTKAYASDLRPNIQVNLIGPTITYTPMMEGILSSDPAERAKKAAALPAMRIGEVDDIKGPAIFLASSASDFVTGSSVYPDGGLTAIG